MSYVGLVPCESTTGQQRRLGSITKTGSAHARRLLVEAAWHDRSRPNLGKALTERQADQPQEAIAVARTAQKRLHRTWTPSKPAESGARSSRSRPPASSPGSSGRSPEPSEPQARHQRHPVSWVGGGPERAGNPRQSFEQPAPQRATLDARQRLPTTNHGPAAHPNPPISGLQVGEDRQDAPVIIGRGGQGKLAENARDVFLHGAFADHEVSGNRAVGAAFGHQPEHLALTGG